LLDLLQNFILHFGELEVLLVHGNEMVERMSADDLVLRAANDGVERALGYRD
jgi:hypothetical protein